MAGPYGTACNMFFADSGESEGWSENFTLATVDLGTAASIVAQAADKRSQFLVATAKIFAYRVTLLGAATRNFNLVHPFSPWQGQRVYPDEELEITIIYNGKSAGGSKRLFEFRGVPSTWVNNKQLTTEGRDNVVKYADPYMSFLKTSQVQLRVPTPNPISTIDHMNTLVIGANCTVVTQAAHGLVMGDVVRMRGCKNNPIFNSTWKVTPDPIDPKSFQLVGSTRYNIQQAGGATWQKVSPNVAAMNNFNFIGCGTRKTGKVFSSARGKKSALIRHR